MDEVTLKLTKDECRQLLRHVFIANWVLTATKDSPERATEDFSQKILKFLATSGVESRIEKDKKSNRYYLAEKLEGDILEEIDEYNEDSFIEELIDQLTKKEIAEKYGEDELAGMNELKFNRIFDDIQAKYIDEISNSGIRNIGLVK